MKELLLLLLTYFVLIDSQSQTSDNVIVDYYPERLNEKNREKKFSPDWADLDKRVIPRWYDDSKIGVFIHWGIFSVPSFGSEWFWKYWKGKSSSYVNFMEKNYPPGITYQDLASQFTAEFFDANKWADLFAKSGIKYVVLTSKHHEGFTLWPSKQSFSWNSVDVGPKRDLVRELAKAIRTKGIKFGLYYSLLEWYNPMYLEDKNTLFSRRVYPEQKIWPDVLQLVNDYEPSILWMDGDWEAGDAYFQSKEFLTWLYNESPIKDDVVVNDRWGIGIPCHHGDFFTCKDRFNPGILQKHKWENSMTIDKLSWGFRRNADVNDYMTLEELLRQLAVTVSCGGNINMNVGPTKEGTISPIFQDRLLAVGKWLAINGEAIYSSSPWIYQNDTLNGKDVWYTCRRSRYDPENPIKPPEPNDVESVYAIFLTWPKDNILYLEDITASLQPNRSKIELLGNSGQVTWQTATNGAAKINMPNEALVTSSAAWVLKFSNLKTS